MNGSTPPAKHEKDDQRSTMETRSFNHLPHLNMTVGVRHYRVPLPSSPMRSDNSCLLGVVTFRESPGRVPEPPPRPSLPITAAAACHLGANI